MAATTVGKLAFRSFLFFRKPHFSLALGIAAATAVIVGALVVGDSVRGSLRNVVLNRLGNIECVLHSRTFFDPKVLSELKLDGAIKGGSSGSGEPATRSVVPLVLLTSSTVEHRREERLLRASQVQVLAPGDEFWQVIELVQDIDLPRALGEDEVAINAALARELQVSIGDELTLRLNDDSGVPADNPLGRREDTSVNLPRQTVVAILPDDSVGDVSFSTNQRVPRNVFCHLATVQDILEVGSRLNAALVLSDHPSRTADAAEPQWCEQLSMQLHPGIEDYGLQLQRHRRVFPEEFDQPAADTASASPEPIYDYYQLTSDQLILDNQTSNAIMAEFRSTRPMRLLTYLANTVGKVEPLARQVSRLNTPGLEAEPSAGREEAEPSAGLEEAEPSAGLEQEAGGREDTDTEDEYGFGVGDVRGDLEVLSRKVPYSLIVGVDDPGELGLREYTQVDSVNLRPPYCWINGWLAEEISVRPGDWIQMTFYEPETMEGQEIEKSARFMVAGIVPFTEPIEGFQRSRSASYEMPPTRFNDPHLTPEVPGLTDKDSIASWDAPFTLDNDLIETVDDEYYHDHRLTPKIFTPYRFASSVALFGSRFGRTTAIRFATADFGDEEVLRERIESALLSTRQQKGFDFLPVRARQLQAASGTTPFDMLFLSLSFFVIVAALLLVTLLFKLGIQQRATQLGTLAAHGFAGRRIRAILLREFALVTVAGSLLGIGLGLGYAWGIILGLESWWIGAIQTQFLDFSFTWRSLLIGAVSGSMASLATIYWGLWRMNKLPPLALLRGSMESDRQQEQNISRPAIALAGVAALAASALIIAGVGQVGMARAGSFFGSGMFLLAAVLLAIRQLLGSGIWSRSKQPQRNSLATLAWRAIGRNPVRSALSLGLLAVASFLITSMSVFQVSPDPRGYGGFDLIGESSQPVYRNLASSRVQRDMLGEAAEKLSGTSIIAMRSRPGEDASCNNLFQVAQPTILGVPRRLRELHDFAPESVEFSWAATSNPLNPWAALMTAATGDARSPIPVILDQNTAAWSLKQGASLDAPLVLQYGSETIHFRTVGLLQNSVLQGKLLIGEANFRVLFPELSGYRYFLVNSGEQPPAIVAEALEDGWSSEGLDLVSSHETLQRLLGVQNTYISAFQSLGALGLLLGTFGLIAVQLRSVLERRRELALMEAVGFSRARIARMLTLETAVLLGGGLMVGVSTSAVALVPFVIETGPQLSWIMPVLLLGLVLLAGFVAALLAIRAAAKRSILEGLRSE